MSSCKCGSAAPRREISRHLEDTGQADLATDLDLSTLFDTIGDLAGDLLKAFPTGGQTPTTTPTPTPPTSTVSVTASPTGKQERALVLVLLAGVAIYLLAERR